MEKKYKLNLEIAETGKALWNSLVTDQNTDYLDDYDGFKITNEDELLSGTVNFCSFKYMDSATVTVYRLNTVVIESEDAEQLRLAESELKRICTEKNVPLIDD